MLSQPHDINHPRVDGASVKLRGRVAKIFPPVANDGSGTAEIIIDAAEHLYREIRIQNLLKNTDGTDVVLQTGWEIEMTIQLRRGAD